MSIQQVRPSNIALISVERNIKLDYEHKSTYSCQIAEPKVVAVRLLEKKLACVKHVICAGTDMAAHRKESRRDGRNVAMGTSYISKKDILYREKEEWFGHTATLRMNIMDPEITSVFIAAKSLHGRK